LTKTFHIYRSSAGSGKTRTLAKEYIKLALRYPDYYRYILAMTFTNKSTQEMKDRIIKYLDDFSRGESEDLAVEILSDLREDGKTITAEQLKEKSKETLETILHKYSQFSVSTIDAFFQKVIRSFTRETGLLGNFRLEVENDLVLEEVADLLMDELTHNTELRDWVVDFSLDRLQDGKDWDVRSGLLDFSREIFKEEFKIIEEEILAKTGQKDFFRSLRDKLRKEKYAFENFVKGGSRKLLKEFQEQGLSVADFKWAAAGSVYSYVAKLAEAEIQLPGKRITEALTDSSQWPGPKSLKTKAIVSLAEQRWQVQLTEITSFIEKNFKNYLSADHVLKNLYTFGLLADISRTLKKYLADNNLMLLSDAPKFLRGVMQEEDTSFIYEKVGSFYRHFLIDEFQDTSGFQWDNLKPLIKNGLAQNYNSLIVGDIKQSIYRWRGGDLNILQEGVKKEIGEDVTGQHTLDRNFRSAGNIVSFNNALFDTAAVIIGKETGNDFPQKSYEDASQKNFRPSGKGYVEIRFLEKETVPITVQPGEKAANPRKETVKFEDLALGLLPHFMEDLQEKGVSIKDIAFLVRDNSEGQLIARRFMEYRASADAKPAYKYDVVSNESLRLDQAASVLILVNAMRFLEDQKNNIARAHLAYEYQKLWQQQTFPNQHKTFAQSKTKDFFKLIPPAFTRQRDILIALPLIELVENLISIFNFDKLIAEIVYLQAFQDLVIEFSAREKSDLASFLQWWDENKHKKSIQVASGVHAAQIITIHKSKGLQFKYVIIPFLCWELNHQGTKAPILWCRSEEDLFRDVGYLPLRYTSKLEDTCFSEFYKEERKRIYLDNLNLLYVAFTRAEEGLIALAPQTKSSSSMSHVGHVVKRAIELNGELQKSWMPEKNKLVIGEIEFQQRQNDTQENSLLLKKYSVVPWRTRLKLRTRGKEFFEPSEKRKKINYGIFIHTLMARIQIREDISTVIGNALTEGLIHQNEQMIITETIHWIVDHPQLKICFEPDWEVKTEASLIVPDGTERRIDRFARKGKDAILIDYKTGDVSPKDETQVKDYLKLVRKMGFEKTRGFLVYPNERKCVEVTL